MRPWAVVLLAAAIPVVGALPVVSASADQQPISSALTSLEVPAEVLGATVPAGAAGPEATKTYEGKRFQTVGATWRPGGLPAGGAIEVRSKTDLGWTEWAALGPRDHAPDSDTVEGRLMRGSSAPIWVGDSTALQVRYRGTAKASGVRLVLVDGGRTPADSRLQAAPIATASAAAGQPFIFSRAQWGADESLRTSKPDCATPNYNSTVKVAFVHHTASANGYAAADVPRLLRNLYQYDVTSGGYCDIPYNFLVDTYGQLWEGRAGGIDRPVLSGATGGFNVDSMAASLIGNFDQTPPPANTMNSLESLLAWKLSLHYRDPRGSAQLTAKGGSGTTAKYADGTTVNFNTISGHRDAGLTACPGAYTYALLPNVRNEVFRIMGAGLVSPTSDRTPRNLSANGAVRVRAGLFTAGDWTLQVRAASGALVSTLSGSGSVLDATWPMTDATGQPVPNGLYTLTAASTQNGSTAAPWSTTAATGAALGSVDALTPGGRQVSARGWAAMGDTAASVQVEVTVDGAVRASQTASLPRPDVAAAFPGYGPAHGYAITASGVEAGFRSVCVRVVDPATGAKATLACGTVEVGGASALPLPSGPPIGNFESATPRLGGLTVSGWILDPDTVESVPTQVWVDGSLRAFAPADQPRADVDSAFAGYGANHGYRIDVDAAPGQRTVCVAAANIGGPGGSSWPCRVVNVPGGSPFGNPERIAAGPGSVTAEGWAIDPDTTGSVPVQLWVDGTLRAFLPADRLRRDVGAAFPLYGPSHGYSVTVPASPGPHQVCVALSNTGAGVDVLLRCTLVSS